MFCGEKTEFCEHCTLGMQHGGVIFGESAMLHPSKQTKESKDLSLDAQAEVECDTPIFLGCEDVVLDPFQVQKVYLQH